MTYNIGDLFLFMDTDLYVITDIKTEYAFHSQTYMKTGNMIDYQYTLILLNPKNNLKLRKRYILGDSLHKSLNNPKSQWKHFPVRN